MVDTLRDYRVKLSKQGLNKRFNSSAVEYLGQLAAKVLSSRLCDGLQMDWASCFGRVLIWDSTIGEVYAKCRDRFPGFGGGASSAALKVQYCFDLLTGNIADLCLLEGRRPDSAYDLQGIERTICACLTWGILS